MSFYERKRKLEFVSDKIGNDLEGRPVRQPDAKKLIQKNLLEEQIQERQRARELERVQDMLLTMEHQQSDRLGGVREENSGLRERKEMLQKHKEWISAPTLMPPGRHSFPTSLVTGRDSGGDAPVSIRKRPREMLLDSEREQLQSSYRRTERSRGSFDAGDFGTFRSVSQQDTYVPSGFRSSECAPSPSVPYMRAAREGPPKYERQDQYRADLDEQVSSVTREKLRPEYAPDGGLDAELKERRKRQEEYEKEFAARVRKPVKHDPKMSPRRVAQPRAGTEDMGLGDMIEENKQAERWDFGRRSTSPMKDNRTEVVARYADLPPHYVKARMEGRAMPEFCAVQNAHRSPLTPSWWNHPGAENDRKYKFGRQ